MLFFYNNFMRLKMKKIEANIVRSFAEVRKDLFELREELNEVKEKLSKLNKTKKRK